MSYYSGDNSNVARKGLHAPKPGLNSVGEYQVAGRPYVKTFVNADITLDILASQNTTADGTSVSFPFVTSRVIVQNAGNIDIVAYFCSANIEDADNAGKSAVKMNKNYFVLPAMAAGASPSTLDLKIKTRKVYIAGYGGVDMTGGQVSVIAELTNIEEPYDCDVDNIDGISG